VYIKSFPHYNRSNVKGSHLKLCRVTFGIRNIYKTQICERFKYVEYITHYAAAIHYHHENIFQNIIQNSISYIQIVYR